MVKLTIPHGQNYLALSADGTPALNPGRFGKVEMVGREEIRDADRFQGPAPESGAAAAA